MNNESPLSGFVEALWLTHAGVMTTACIFLVKSYPQHWSYRFVAMMVTSWLALMWVDVYTIVAENYPVISPKAFIMLAANFVFDIGLWKTVVRWLSSDSLSDGLTKLSADTLKNIHFKDLDL